MKRLTIRALLALAMLSIPVGAFAGRWVTREIGWQTSYQGGCATCTNIIVRDTVKAAIAAGDQDTTGDFSLNDAVPLPRGVTFYSSSDVLLAPADSTVLAYILFQQDSTSAPTTPTATGITALIDGRVKALGPNTALSDGWVKADSAFVNGAAGGTLITGSACAALPIRTITPYGNINRWENLRARITTTAGVMTGIRAWIRYWTPN